MEKNVTVVDEKGNKTGATYPKRAKGLVKKGRARYVDENTICLACPANLHSEENMEEKLTIRDVVERVDTMRAECATLNEALLNLSDRLPSDIEDIETAAMIIKLFDSVTSQFYQREMTTQKLLDFYSMVYNDLKNATDSSAHIDIDEINRAIDQR